MNEIESKAMMQLATRLGIHDANILSWPELFNSVDEAIRYLEKYRIETGAYYAIEASLQKRLVEAEEQIKIQREGHMAKIKEIRDLRKDLASLRADYYNMYQELERLKNENQD